MVLFKEDMVDLFLNKDVFILVCLQYNEKIDFGMEIVMIVCVKINGVQLCVFNILDDFD